MVHYCAPLEIFLEWTSMICLFPYRFCRSKLGKISIEDGKVRKWIWIFIILLETVSTFGSLRKLYQDPIVTPQDYFNFCGILANIMKHTAFLIATWTKKENFYKALILCDKFWRQIYMKPKGMFVRYTVFLLCLFELVMSILPTLTCEYILPDTIPWSVSNAAAGHIYKGRHIFLLENNATISTLKDIDGVQITAINIILGIVHAFVYLTRGVVGHCIHLGIMMAVVSLWGAVRTLRQEAVGQDGEDTEVTEEETAEALTFFSIVPPAVREVNPVVPRHEERNVSNETAEGRTVNKLVARYISAKTFSDNINTAIGGMVLFALLEWTMFYSVFLNELFLPGTWNKKLGLILGLLSQAIIFCFSIDVYLEMHTFKMWLSQDQLLEGTFPEKKAKMMMYQIDNHAVGISAWGLFTLNFGLVCEVISITVTYFLIVVQNAPDGKKIK